MVSICVIGMWHLGCVTAACLARRHKVIGCDFDAALIAELKNARPPIFESGLPQAISDALGSGLLSFSTDLAASAASSDVIYLAFDTPVDESDKIDMSILDSTMAAIMPSLRDGQLIIISSQVPVGTSRKVLERAASAGKKISVCYSPENLRLGDAIETFFHPDRVVIGTSDQKSKALVEEVFSVVGGKRIYMGLESAEMSKHAMNAYLATMISFSGEICNLCEISGADANLVMKALFSERRVSPQAPLLPGLGFGGGTLARDVQVLRSMGKNGGVGTNVLDATYQSNKKRMSYVQERLEKILGSLSGKKLAFFGLAYKPGTNTLRRSLALEIIASISGAGCSISAYDPEISEVPSASLLEVCKSAQDAALGSDAIIITTAWEQFKFLPWGQLCKSMRRPVILDARNLLDRSSLDEFIEYYGVGFGYGGK